MRSFPLVEKGPLLWIWMGEAAKADPALIFKVEHWDDPRWGRTDPESMTVDCNYLYVTDNLLDPSHVAWVHASSFGNAACEETPLKTELRDDGVVVSRWMLDTEVAPFYQQFVDFTGNTDRQQHYEVRFPSNAIIKAVFTPAGTGGSVLPAPGFAAVCVLAWPCAAMGWRAGHKLKFSTNAKAKMIRFMIVLPSVPALA